MRKLVAAVLVNVALLLVIFGSIEGYFRWISPPAPRGVGAGDFRFRPVPYTMIASRPNRPARDWQDVVNGGRMIHPDMRTNNAGFNDPHEFSLTVPYRKEPNERVVVVVGNSVVFGVGATRWETTIAGRTRHHLNEAAPDGRRYTVINLGMGGWIAYQEFVGLELWGGQFDPDWVVVLDGHADAAVGCGESQGVGNPLFFPAMQGFINAYFSTRGIVRYRGWLENQLVKHSAAYHALTGKEYIPDPVPPEAVSPEATGQGYRNVIAPTKMGDARQMLALYLKAEEAMLRLYPDARYLMSTAPSLNQFRGDFADAYDRADPEEHRAAMAKRSRELDANLAAHETEDCGPASFAPAWTYAVVKGAFGLEDLAAAYRAKGRYVEYHNLGTLFPDPREDRRPYFIDPGHLSEKGQDVVGAFYARHILAADAAAAAR